MVLNFVFYCEGFVAPGRTGKVVNVQPQATQTQQRDCDAFARPVLGCGLSTQAPNTCDDDVEIVSFLLALIHDFTYSFLLTRPRAHLDILRCLYQSSPT